MIAPRLACIGQATPSEWAHVFACADRYFGQCYVALVYSEADTPLSRVGGVTSRYHVAQSNRDAAMLAGADFVADMRTGVITPKGTTMDPYTEVNEVDRYQDENRRHEFIWMDLETTGLDPTQGLVLEFAAVLCEDARGDDFNIVQPFTGAIHYTQEELAAVPIDTRVWNMHTKNGLWTDVASSSTRVEDVDSFLVELVHSLNARPRSIVLAGSSVHFDRSWCMVHFPQFAGYLSHRVFDVTTLRRAVDAWGVGTPQWERRTSHRALDDILATIREARIARTAAFGASREALLSAALKHVAHTSMDPDLAQFACRVLDGSAFPPGWGAP